MSPLTAHEIAHATGGRVIGGDADAIVTCVCTDSRSMKPQSLFVALKGETFDGHDHVDKAVEAGATVLLVDRETPHTAVLVDDTRRAMGRLATYVRRKLGQTKVIAVAGSNGKTGTKHLIHSVLSTRLKGTMSPKSFNNDVGVPVTLFAADPADDYVIVEVGTNHPGEVRHLSMMCEPDIAAITSIGEEHLEFFKTLDGVRDENAQITAGMHRGGLVVIYGDDDGLRSRLPHAQTFGFGPSNDWTATNIHTTLEGTHFRSLSPRERAGVRARAATDDSPLGNPSIPLPKEEGTAFTLPQIGRHSASNALVAIAIAHHLGLSNDDIRQGLAAASSPEMRMQKRTIGAITLLNDAYNANPTSVRAALKTLAEIDWPGRKIIVLGMMGELGEHAPQAHKEMAALAKSLAPAGLYFVGAGYEPFATPWFADSEQAAATIAESMKENDLVLIKGSRSMKMERVEKAIEKRFA